MSLLSHLASLRDHGEWADQRLLHAVRGADVPSALRELAHVRGAQEIWLSRIEQRASTLSVWPELSIDDLATVGNDVDAAWRSRLAQLTEPTLDDTISYTNLAGEAFAMSLGDIMLHVMLHGQYHRAKANVALRAATGSGVGIDYLLWCRTVAR